MVEVVVEVPTQEQMLVLVVLVVVVLVDTVDLVTIRHLR